MIALYGYRCSGEIKAKDALVSMGYHFIKLYTDRPCDCATGSENHDKYCHISTLDFNLKKTHGLFAAVDTEYNYDGYQIGILRSDVESHLKDSVAILTINLLEQLKQIYPLDICSFLFQNDNHADYIQALTNAGYTEAVAEEFYINDVDSYTNYQIMVSHVMNHSMNYVVPAFTTGEYIHTMYERFLKVPRLYIDFDGTLFDTIESICGLYNEDYSAFDRYDYVSDSDVKTWAFDELTCAAPEAIDNYFNMPRFFKHLYPMHNAIGAVNRLSEKYNICIVSMGHQPNLKLKSDFLFRKVVDQILPPHEFAGVNIDKYPDKKTVNMSDGILIDDVAKNLDNSNAVRKICYGKEFDWNKDWTGERYEGWDEITEVLLGIA